jgi:hypothetical protein
MKTAFFLALVGLAACANDNATAPATRRLMPGAAVAARSQILPVVSLIVTVDDVDGAGNAYGIQSDGQGAYVDGSQGVGAAIDQYGTFAFNTYDTNVQSKRRPPAQRWVRYNFDHPIDPTNTYRPSPTNDQNYHFSTGPSDYNAWAPLQNLAVGASQCGYMGNSVSNVSTSWLVSFHKGKEDTADSPTSFAVFTRVSATVWTAQPTGSCSASSNVASLRDAATGTLYGYYSLPFHFTLTAR